MIAERILFVGRFGIGVELKSRRKVMRGEQLMLDAPCERDPAWSEEVFKP